MNKKGEIFFTTFTGIYLMYAVSIAFMWGVSQFDRNDTITFKAKSKTVDTVASPAPPEASYHTSYPNFGGRNFPERSQHDNR